METMGQLLTINFVFFAILISRVQLYRNSPFYDQNRGTFIWTDKIV